jgi:hypothetical protein
MENVIKNFFNVNTLMAFIAGAAITYLVDEYFFDIPQTAEDITVAGSCETDPSIYRDWYQNYNPSNSLAVKVSDAEYQVAKRTYDGSIPMPVLDGAYGGTMDVKFLSSFLCQAMTDGATNISFNIGKPEYEGAKVHLFSNTPSGMTKQVMTFSKVSGCPPNCRDRDTMASR